MQNKKRSVLLPPQTSQNSRPVQEKPEPGPLLKYMERTGAKPSEVLYVGDTVYDMQCARGAGVDFALARWGNPDGRVDADYDEPTPMALLEKLR